MLYFSRLLLFELLTVILEKIMVDGSAYFGQQASIDVLPLKHIVNNIPCTANFRAQPFCPEARFP